MGAVYSICFDGPSSIPQALSPSFRKLKSLRSFAPWAVQDSREYLVRTKKFAIKEHIQCKFEGFGSSERCRCEDFKQQKGRHAITGLHSNWVTEHILATARPSDALILDYSVIEQFRACGLGAIFNLQEPGEHGDCGPGILVESGFSYTPELFMRSGIFYYNFPWRDMTCPDVDYTFNIVAVMDFHISKGVKVAVHCHSGLGRTGLVIACYLVYAGKHDAVSAVEFVRKYRHGALQTKHQVLHVKEFEDYVAGLKMVFVEGWQTLDARGSIKGTHPTLEVLMARQRKILHGAESRLLRYTPKILVSLISELSERILFDETNRNKIVKEFLKTFSVDSGSGKNERFFDTVQAAKRDLNAGQWNIMKVLDIEVLVQLFLDWLLLLKEPIIPDSALKKVLSRGKMQNANYELKKGGKYCFFTIRLLACWLLQIALSDRVSRRRLFGGLAHILLHPSVLPKERNIENGRPSRQCTAYHCPSLLDAEFGLFLEAAANYWCQLLVAQRKLGPITATSPKLKERKNDDLWVYDKAGVEADILGEAVQERDLEQQQREELLQYLSSACVEEIVNEVCSSYGSSFDAGPATVNSSPSAATSSSNSRRSPRASPLTSPRTG